MNDLLYAKEFFETYGNFCASTDAILEKHNIKISKYNKVTYKNINKVLCKHI
jgi:hypothetical protein